MDGWSEMWFYFSKVECGLTVIVSYPEALRLICSVLFSIIGWWKRRRRRRGRRGREEREGGGGAAHQVIYSLFLLVLYVCYIYLCVLLFGLVWRPVIGWRGDSKWPPPLPPLDGSSSLLSVQQHLPIEPVNWIHQVDVSWGSGAPHSLFISFLFICIFCQKIRKYIFKKNESINTNAREKKMQWRGVGCSNQWFPAWLRPLRPIHPFVGRVSIRRLPHRSVDGVTVARPIPAGSLRWRTGPRSPDGGSNQRPQWIDGFGCWLRANWWIIIQLKPISGFNLIDSGASVECRDLLG